MRHVVSMTFDMASGKGEPCVGKSTLSPIYIRAVCSICSNSGVNVHQSSETVLSYTQSLIENLISGRDTRKPSARNGNKNGESESYSARHIIAIFTNRNATILSSTQYEPDTKEVLASVRCDDGSLHRC